MASNDNLYDKPRVVPPKGHRYKETYPDSKMMDLLTAEVSARTTFEIMQREGKKVCPSRWPRDYFGDLCARKDLTEAEVTHLRLVLECSHDLRIEQQIGWTREQIMQNKTIYNMEHFEWAEYLTR